MRKLLLALMGFIGIFVFVNGFADPPHRCLWHAYVENETGLANIAGFYYVEPMTGAHYVHKYSGRGVKINLSVKNGSNRIATDVKVKASYYKPFHIGHPIYIGSATLYPGDVYVLEFKDGKKRQREFVDDLDRKCMCTDAEEQGWKKYKQ